MHETLGILSWFGNYLKRRVFVRSGSLPGKLSPSSILLRSSGQVVRTLFHHEVPGIDLSAIEQWPASSEPLSELRASSLSKIGTRATNGVTHPPVLAHRDDDGGWMDVEMGLYVDSIQAGRGRTSGGLEAEETRKEDFLELELSELSLSDDILQLEGEKSDASCDANAEKPPGESGSGNDMSSLVDDVSIST